MIRNGKLLSKQDKSKLVKLWIGDEDYGIMSEKAAEMYLTVHRQECPDEPYRVEPVDDEPNE